jgi:hypothetical protein
MLGSNRTRANVIQRSIVRLRDDRIDRFDIRHAGLLEHPPDHRVGRLPNAERAGEKERSLELAELSELRDAGDLAESIPDVKRGGHSISEQVPAVRENRRHPCSHGIAFNDRRLTHAHAGDIGDRVELTRRKHTRLDTEISRASTLGLKRYGDSRHGQNRDADGCAKLHETEGERL